jgi:predicted Zn-dependent protease
VLESGARCLGADPLQGLLGHEFGNLIQADFGAFNFARTFHHRLGHAIDVAVHAVKQHLNLYAHSRFVTYSKEIRFAH